MTPEEKDDLLLEQRGDIKYLIKKMDSFCTFKDATIIDIANFKTHCENQKDLPARVSSLEKFKWLATGAMILLGTLIGWNWIIIGGAK